MWSILVRHQERGTLPLKFKLSRILLLIMSSTITSCSISTDLKKTQAAAEQFHSWLSAANYDAIYLHSEFVWQSSISRESSHQFFARLRKAMGGCPDSNMVSWNERLIPEGRFVNVQYLRKCENGEMTESFTWRVEGPEILLTGYNASSPILLKDEGSQHNY